MSQTLTLQQIAAWISRAAMLRKLSSVSQSSVLRCFLTPTKARNILLLSLIVDDADGTKDVSTWNLFYHFRIEEASLQLLRTQARKLQALSSSLETWHKSEYGKLIRMCDNGSLAECRQMWSFYAVDRKGKELSSFEQHHEGYIRKSNEHKTRRGIGMNLTGFRSSAPTILESLTHLDDLHQHYWKHGSTDLDKSSLSLALHANPMFMTLDHNVVLHYGTDPLLGFHLATAYVPLTPTSPLFRSSARLAPLESVVDAAKTEFRSWATSFRNYAHLVTLRFFVGDALALSHSLQHRGYAASAAPTHCYRDRFHFDPLILDGEDYAEGGAAPLAFTIIDTSNLIDHVGALNLLVATAPLLANEVAATLYTEKLVRSDSTYSSLFDNLLCGPLPTVSMLLGLTPVDFVTNTSALSSGDEILLDASTRHAAVRSAGETSSDFAQLFTRIAWKRPIRMDDGLTLRGSPRRIILDSSGLAKILYQIYLKMFENEDVMRLMSDLTMLNVQKLSIPTYQRASFVAFIKVLRIRVDADWEKTVRSLRDLIEANVSHLMTTNYIQELYVWLHLLDLYSVDILKTSQNRSGNNSKTKDLRDWKDIPAVVCVTLEVPREKLTVFTGEDVLKVGTPPVHCFVQGSSNGRPWQNIFGACQIGFGKVESHGTPFTASFEVSIREDRSAWSGASPLLVSFYAPTWMLLQQPRTASVAFGIQTTPQSTMAFLSKLGLQLTVYQTTLSDLEHVYFSKNLPNQSAPFSICNVPVPDAALPPPNIQDLNAITTITATVDPNTAKVASLTGRLDILSDNYKTALKAGGAVTSASKTPFNFVITLQPGLNFTIDFPVAVLESSLKTRIARRSSYIELVAQVANGTDWPAFSSFMYPTFLDSATVTAWNMPYLNLESLPILDTSKKQHARLSWLTTHTSMMFSSRERVLRNNPSIHASAGERSRVEFKDSLFSIFMHYSGLQGQRAHIFGIDCPTNGGVHILFFISCLRLDLSNRTVVLDAAALPLYDNLMPRVASFLHTLVGNGLCQIRVSEDEMRVWKQTLPAFVERCRTWSHKSNCEYLAKRRVPLSTEKGERSLCSCAEGTLPKGVVTDVPKWNTVAKYAVRVAISPSCSAAMFEGGDDGSKLDGSLRNNNTNACRACGKEKKVDGSGLLSCARCQRVKYCSRECQRADWKEHKGVCGAS
jgi:MYND finger